MEVLPRPPVLIAAGLCSSTQVRGIVDASEVETEYILWTDPDVVFLQDIGSCRLPRPHALSIGPDSDQGGIGNCGVIYFNVSAYTSIFDDLVVRLTKLWLMGIGHLCMAASELPLLSLVYRSMAVIIVSSRSDPRMLHRCGRASGSGSSRQSTRACCAATLATASRRSRTSTTGSSTGASRSRWLGARRLCCASSIFMGPSAPTHGPLCSDPNAMCAITSVNNCVGVFSLWQAQDGALRAAAPQIGRRVAHQNRQMV